MDVQMHAIKPFLFKPFFFQMHLQAVGCFVHFQDQKFHSVQFARLKKAGHQGNY